MKVFQLTNEKRIHHLANPPPNQHKMSRLEQGAPVTNVDAKKKAADIRYLLLEEHLKLSSCQKDQI
jgi:hypothetical protein